MNIFFIVILIGDEDAGDVFLFGAALAAPFF